MSRISAFNPRTTSLQMSDALLSALRRTQKGLLEAQNQIATGQEVSRPSDAPAKASAILLLQRALEAREQYLKNLTFSQTILNNVDQALSDASDLVMEARSIGSSQIGIGSTTDTRKNQASVIDGMIRSLLDIANRSSQGVSLFGGSTTLGGGDTGQPIFVFRDDLGGIRYLGSTENLQADLGLDEPLGVNSNGRDAFGALSVRVLGDRDLDPQLTVDTFLEDLNGAQRVGVRLGVLRVQVNASAVDVDLSGAQTVGDVLTRINAAIAGIDPGAGSLGISGSAFELTANAGYTITISDVGTGRTAGDLGIAITASGGSQSGLDVDPRLTSRTRLAALGVSVDWASGLKITQGAITKVADFSSATTVQDLMNVIDALDLGLRLQINETGTGLNLVSDLSGPAFSVGEVAGGTTATDLGLRTFNRSTRLSDLNFGLGVSRVSGQDDFAIELHDGTRFSVNIDTAQTVGDVIDLIRSAAEAVLGVGNVGWPGQVGTLFNVGLAPDGNGLYMEDNTAGAGDFRVVQLGTSLAATDLGIYRNAQGGSVLAGTDVAKVRVEGVFTHLIALRDALVGDDSRGITLATSALERDVELLAQARADVGVRARRIQQQIERSEQMKLAEQTMLSELRDTDMTAVLVRYSLLQQQLEAGLRMGAQYMQLSLLDFLD